MKQMHQQEIKTPVRVEIQRGSGNDGRCARRRIRDEARRIEVTAKSNKVWGKRWCTGDSLYKNTVGPAKYILTARVFLY
jgi:hypothetical protein